jgi:CDP-6-deoxy-D-xylo-4-hexulose-3-dehydrase
MKYPLAYDTWDEREVEAIHKVIETGRYTMGPKVEEFENKFAERMGVKHAIMTNSRGSANLLMISALNYDWTLPKHAEVIVPAVSWSTTYFPIHQMGMTMVFVDVNDKTYNIDPYSIVSAITDKTKAILAVNLLGNPCDMDTLTTICSENDILLLEDNCESLGATYRGQQAGTFGTMGTYSFFFSHHLQTMEGGMIVTDDDYDADVLRSLRAHGWIRDLKTDFLWGSRDKVKNKSDFKNWFTFVTPGYSVRPLEMSGAIGCVQLEKMDDMIHQRKTNASYFKKRIKEFEFFISTQEEWVGESSWFGFGMVVDKDRDKFANYLTHNGIATRPIVAGNFINQPVVIDLNHKVSGELTTADIIDKRGLFVGNDSKDMSNNIDYLMETIGNYRYE